MWDTAMPQSRSGLMDTWVPPHATGTQRQFVMACAVPTNSPDSKRKPARQTRRCVTGQYFENPIQSLREMRLEHNLEEPVVANWGAAEHRKAGGLWSASTARGKYWSSGLKKTQGKKKPLISWYPHPKIHSTDPNLRLCQFVS